MSMYTSHHCRSESSSSTKKLKNISQELKSLKLWRQQEVIQKEKKKIERDVCLSILEKELRILSQKDERKIKEKQSIEHPKNLEKERKVGYIYEKFGQKGNRDEEYSHKRKIYNPHFQRKERMCFEPRSLYYSIELELYIPYFDGNKNVEAYLKWETKVDQIYEKH